MPFFAQSKIGQWQAGKKSQIRIIASHYTVMIEVELSSGYRISDYSNFKLDFFKHTNFQSLATQKLKFLTKAAGKNTLAFIPIRVIDAKQNVEFEAKISLPVCKKDCILEEFIISFDFPPNLNDIQALELIKSYELDDDQSDSYNIVYIMLLSIIGGFILNFMPCVLPVLGIKLAILTKNSKHSKNVNLVATILGIIFSYLIIALMIIILKEFGIYHGFGFYFQNTNFVIFITIILILAASTILERIYIPTPKVINDLSAKSTTKLNSAIALSFLTGCFTTLMATPCTAPFISTAVAFALQGSNLDIILVFCMMGTGLSLPYILVLIAPKTINFLPKSGAWMSIFKKSMAALTYCAVFWFTYIVSNQLCNLSAIVLILLLLLLKFSIEVNLRKALKLILTLLVLFALFTLPNLANIEEFRKEKELSTIWHEFQQDEIQKQLDKGNIVVVDVTASWCGTCQLNKLMVLDSDYFIKITASENIYAMRLDITNSFPLEVKNFMKSKGHYAIPFTIVIGSAAPQGIVLSSILTISEFKNTLKQVK